MCRYLRQRALMDAIANTTVIVIIAASMTTQVAICQFEGFSQLKSVKLETPTKARAATIIPRTVNIIAWKLSILDRKLSTIFLLPPIPLSYF